MMMKAIPTIMLNGGVLHRPNLAASFVQHVHNFICGGGGRRGERDRDRSQHEAETIFCCGKARSVN